MDFAGIDAIFNRINEIETKADSLEVPEQPFSDVLQSARTAQSNAQVPAAPETALKESPILTEAENQTTTGLTTYKGYPMTRATAEAFQNLEKLIDQHFPGRPVTITSTTDGQHEDPKHYQGEAVDFVVDGLSDPESKLVEDLSRQAGFNPYNEYLHDSRFKTGKHMHIDLKT